MIGLLHTKKSMVSKMDRRTFLGSSIAALVLPVSAISTENLGQKTLVKWLPETEQLMHRIISSFPEQIPSEGNVMGFLITNEEKAGFRIENKVANASEEYDLEDIFTDDFADETYENYDRTQMATPEALEVSSIVRASNRIARITRRGAGNHYAVFNDHILVWYAQTGDRKSSACDTPVARVGKNVIINSNFKDYFFKVKGIRLTDNHHTILNQLGYKRII